jgi:hypothetical protein
VVRVNTLAGWAATVLVLAVAVTAYLIACRVWPFTACPKCDALGRIKSPTGKNWRTCKRCKGTGQRLRLGRRLWHHTRGTYERIT